MEDDFVKVAARMIGYLLCYLRGPYQEFDLFRPSGPTLQGIVSAAKGPLNWETAEVWQKAKEYGKKKRHGNLMDDFGIKDNKKRSKLGKLVSEGGK
jgi:hypothetical protein